jgi:predicted amidophosphoribosyltransferase
MAIAIFFVLAVLVAAIIAYPLLPGRMASQPAPAVTEGDIERAVRHLRRARSRGELHCPACGRAHRAGDRFCVRCGNPLPQDNDSSKGLVCRSCGAPIRDGDRFCSRCGQGLAAEEVI